MRLFRHQLRWEQRLFWRSRESAVFVFLFPILLFALLTAVYNGRIDGRPASWALLAGMIGYGAANTAFSGLGITLVSRREIGILKRIRATPLPLLGSRPFDSTDAASVLSKGSAETLLVRTRPRESRPGSFIGRKAIEPCEVSLQDRVPLLRLSPPDIRPSRCLWAQTGWMLFPAYATECLTADFPTAWIRG